MSRIVMHVLDRYGERKPTMYWLRTIRGARMSKELVKQALTKYFAKEMDEDDTNDAVTHVLNYCSIQMSHNCAHICDEEQDFLLTII